MVKPPPISHPPGASELRLLMGAGAHERFPLMRVLGDVLAGSNEISLIEKTLLDGEQMRAAYAALTLSSPRSAELMGARRFALDRLREMIRPEPRPEQVDLFVRKALTIPPGAGVPPVEREVARQALLVYDTLSPKAKEALYTLLVEDRTPVEKLRTFLQNRPADSIDLGASRILEAVTDLFNMRVQNFECGFHPALKNDRLLSSDPRVVSSTVGEYLLALRYACRPGVVAVALDLPYSLDWSVLGEPERGFLYREVEPSLGKTLEDVFSNEPRAHVDIAVKYQERWRFVELTTVSGDSLHWDKRHLAVKLLQVFRYALAIRQTRHTEGIEYLIQTSGDPNRLSQDHRIGKLREALEHTGVPFVIRIENGGILTVGSREEMAALPSPDPVPFVRTRPLPPLHTHRRGDREAVSPPPPPAPRPPKHRPHPKMGPPPAAALASLPWTDEIKEFLDKVVPRIKVKRITSTSNFLEQAQNVLRFAQQEEIVSKLGKELERRGLSPKNEPFKGLIEAFRRGKKNTASKETLALLIRIADRAV